jgi:hypothetical protein
LLAKIMKNVLKTEPPERQPNMKKTTLIALTFVTFASSAMAQSTLVDSHGNPVTSGPNHSIVHAQIGSDSPVNKHYVAPVLPKPSHLENAHHATHKAAAKPAAAKKPSVKKHVAKKTAHKKTKAKKAITPKKATPAPVAKVATPAPAVVEAPVATAPAVAVAPATTPVAATPAPVVVSTPATH